MAFDLDPSYKQVPERIADFKAKHPEGSLRPLNPERPYDIIDVAGQTFIVYAAAAFRTPDDPAPGVGTAWEPVPGKTPYTRLSELQNAETSAWGRAIVAVLASESKAVASAEDVRNRRADQDAPEYPCKWCEFTTDERDAMREHLVARHEFVRQDDGSVVAPKTEPAPQPQAEDETPEQIAARIAARAEQVKAEEPGLAERAARLAEKAAENAPADLKKRAAADA